METTTNPAIWLENLPEDVNNRIIRFLDLVDDQGKLTTEAFNLAHVSRRQARQVHSSMDDKFFLKDIRDMNPKAALTWCLTAFPHVRHLFVSENDTRKEELLRMILLKAPHLERLSIRADAKMLYEIAHSRFLRALFVSASCVTSLADHVPLFFRTLEKLNLTTLHLDCLAFHPDPEANEANCSRHRSPSACGLEQLLRYDCDPAALGRHCPNVKTLGVHCFHESEGLTLSAFVNGFPKLREFRANFMPSCINGGRTMPNTLVPKLQALDSVHLKCVISGYALAADIGAPVKTLISLETHRNLLHKPDDLARLSKCPNLEEAWLFMKPGVEKTLPKVARNLVALKFLCLSWETECQRMLQAGSSGIEHIIRVAEEYHSPAPFILLQAVRDLPKLTKLALVHIKIENEEVTSLLFTIGKRLKELALSIRGQSEPPAERLTTVMEEIATSNRDLEVFDLYDADVVKTDNLVWMQFDGSLSESRSFRQSSEHRMQKAFSLMRRNAPFADWSSFAEAVLDSYDLHLVAAT